MVYFGKKKGSTYVEVFDNDSIRESVENAVKIAKISPEDKDFKSLPSPQAYNVIPMEELVSKNTINTTPGRISETSD